MWTTCRVACRPAGASHPRGLVAWFAKGCACEFGHIRQSISLILRFGTGAGIAFGTAVILAFATALVASFLHRLIRRFAISLVQQIGCQLLAQSRCRQQQLLRARRSPPEIRAGALSLPGLSVPPTL